MILPTLRTSHVWVEPQPYCPIAAFKFLQYRRYRPNLSGASVASAWGGWQGWIGLGDPGRSRSQWKQQAKRP